MSEANGPQPDLPEKNNEWMGRFFVMVLFWLILFALTLVVSGLDRHSLVSAFVAWLGGLVSAQLVYIWNNRQ